jgi:hypothetical protein
MSGWWNHAVTNGDLLLYLLGAGLFYVVKELAAGFREGWRRSGKSFRDEVRERVKRGSA